MKTSGNTILITGGATGIGFALAEALLKEGNQVLICGRREERLQEAKSKLPEVVIKPFDLANAKDRQDLFEWAVKNFPETNILVNNAGIQRMIDFRKGTEELLGGENEIEINFNAPVHLSALFIPHLLKKEEAAIVNVSSGLGFIPLAMMPVYCATKSALHTFSWSLRHQLRQTSIKVFEIIPPTVDTELDKGARGRRSQAYRGIPSGDVAVAALEALAKDEFEKAVGQAESLRTAARTEPEQRFQMMNSH
jgi:uncharacterized oxidoreductase